MYKSIIIVVIKIYSQTVKNIDNRFKLVEFHSFGTGVINNTVGKVVYFISVSVACR